MLLIILHVSPNLRRENSLNNYPTELQYCVDTKLQSCHQNTSQLDSVLKCEL